MVFTSLRFIVFMAVVFTAYYTIPPKRQWQLLLLASYVFYACASPVYLIFLVFTTAVTYAGGVAMDRNLTKLADDLKAGGEALSRQEKKARRAAVQRRQKGILAAVITVLLLMLAVFKYAAFIWQNISWLLGVFGVNVGSVTLQFILPLGLSFYMFQSMGYCIDVYRETVPAEHDFFRHALYVSFFPQLLQGPIGDHSRLAPQLFKEHAFNYTQAKFGLQRVAWGFFKKLVVANEISLGIDGVWTAYSDYPSFLFWAFVLVLYAFQLYADFSGYMDIALGCAQMLGITLDENFQTPFLSKSIAEYWRRWHITLGAWFRTYVFYPILRSKFCNGIRKRYRGTYPVLSTVLPDAIALLIVWTLIGLWHGADWSYVAYSLYHASFIILSTILAPVYARLNKQFPRKASSKLYALFQIARTFVIVCFGFVIFRPADLSVTDGILRQMLAGPNIMVLLRFGYGEPLKVFVKCFIGIAVLIGVDIWHYRSNGASLREKISRCAAWQRWLIYIVGLMMILVLGAYWQSGLDQFAYFRF